MDLYEDLKEARRIEKQLRQEEEVGWKDMAFMAMLVLIAILFMAI